MTLKKRIIKLLEKRDYRIGELGTALKMLGGGKRMFLRGYCQALADDKIIKIDKKIIIKLVRK